MGFALSRRGIHHALRMALIALFIGQGLLKVVIFTMPGTIAFFESTGSPGWLPALMVFAELFLIMQIGLNMGGFYPAPAAIIPAQGGEGK
jgi:uncharacterized membrane protein YphA (DoxX/SURF4 family)